MYFFPHAVTCGSWWWSKRPCDGTRTPITRISMHMYKITSKKKRRKITCAYVLVFCNFSYLVMIVYACSVQSFFSMHFLSSSYLLFCLCISLHSWGIYFNPKINKFVFIPYDLEVSPLFLFSAFSP